jgi:hypothetical protein
MIFRAAAPEAISSDTVLVPAVLSVFPASIVIFVPADTVTPADPETIPVTSKLPLVAVNVRVPTKVTVPS